VGQANVQRGNYAKVVTEAYQNSKPNDIAIRKGKATANNLEKYPEQHRERQMQ
jgi:hypothetical protein